MLLLACISYRDYPTNISQFLHQQLRKKNHQNKKSAAKKSFWKPRGQVWPWPRFKTTFPYNQALVLVPKKVHKKMVFIRTLFLKDTSMVYLEGCSSLEECRSALTTRSGVPGDHLVFYNNGRRMMGEGSPVDALATIDACLGLPGGKGGFGSMLRALGAQIEKTTNK